MTDRLLPPVGERDHVAGDATARVTLVEYGDYECPFCGRAQGVLRALRRRLGEQLRFVFRHFPLAELHPHAVLAAETAEAAGAQGRFWDMHDTLFENQDALEPPDLLEYAAGLGLDLDAFVDDLRSHRFRDRVSMDLLTGERSGVQATPAFFINGVRHRGGWSFDALLQALAGTGGIELGV